MARPRPPARVSRPTSKPSAVPVWAGWSTTTRCTTKRLPGHFGLSRPSGGRCWFSRLVKPSAWDSPLNATFPTAMSPAGLGLRPSWACRCCWPPTRCSKAALILRRRYPSRRRLVIKMWPYWLSLSRRRGTMTAGGLPPGCRRISLRSTWPLFLPRERS